MCRSSHHCCGNVTCSSVIIWLIQRGLLATFTYQAIRSWVTCKKLCNGCIAKKTNSTRKCFISKYAGGCNLDCGCGTSTFQWTAYCSGHWTGWSASIDCVGQHCFLRIAEIPARGNHSTQSRVGVGKAFQRCSNSCKYAIQRRVGVIKRTKEQIRLPTSWSKRLCRRVFDSTQTVRTGSHCRKIM